MSQVMDFGGLRIAFDDRVLRPRPWTAAQSQWAGELLPGLPPGPVLELCSGAGQIGLLAVTGSGRQLVCVDASDAAADYTAANATTAGITVEVRHGTLQTAVAADERFPLILADPPWVPSAGTSRFPHDPISAIDGGADGLAVALDCVAVIGRHLADGGVALLQLGSSAQATVVGRELIGHSLVAGELRGFGEHGVVLRIDRAG